MKNIIFNSRLFVYTKVRAVNIGCFNRALTIIEPIKDACDTETTGILGAINKCLWIETRDASYLDRAIDSYSKGWNLYKDYYTGENYALCLLEMAKKRDW